MAKKIKPKVGDIFSLEVLDNNEYIFGRILFDVTNQYLKKGFDLKRLY